MEGVLYEIPVDQLAALDRAEGSKYARQSITVETSEGARAAHIRAGTERARSVA